MIEWIFDLMSELKSKHNACGFGVNVSLGGKYKRVRGLEVSDIKLFKEAVPNHCSSEASGI